MQAQRVHVRGHVTLVREQLLLFRRYKSAIARVFLLVNLDQQGFVGQRAFCANAMSTLAMFIRAKRSFTRVL